jgi:hypothetical protein
MKRMRDTDTAVSPTSSSEFSSNSPTTNLTIRKRHNDGDEFVDAIEMALQDAVGMLNRLTDRRLLAKRNGAPPPLVADKDAVLQVIETVCMRVSLFRDGGASHMPLLEALYIGVAPLPLL